jgi:hypothetical protein
MDKSDTTADKLIFWAIPNYYMLDNQLQRLFPEPNPHP